MGANKRSRRVAVIAATIALLGAQLAAADVQVRTAAFDYDAEGVLRKEIVEPDNAELCAVVEYDYDGFGNRTTVSRRNCNGSTYGFASWRANEAAGRDGPHNFAPRRSVDSYGGEGPFVGQFVTRSENALGHAQTQVVDPRFGVVTRQRGPNGLETRWEFDGFGRKSHETRGDGTTTRWRYAWCNQSPGLCPERGWTYTQIETTGEPTVRRFEDQLGRVVAVETQGFDGHPVRSHTLFDDFGRAWATSLPIGGPDGTARTLTDLLAGNLFSRIVYDVTGRVVQTDEPPGRSAGARTITTYDGLAVTVSVGSPAGVSDLSGENAPQGQVQTRRTIRNSQGQVLSVTDAAGDIRFDYDALGNPVLIERFGSITQARFDLRGRRTALIDPDRGSWHYAYDALGQIVAQTDAKGDTTVFRYDLLGRLVERGEPTDRISRFSYDGTAEGCAAGGATIGKRVRADTTTDTALIHCFDALGRPVATTHVIGTARLTESTSYDGLSRVDTVRHPGGIGLRRVYSERDGRLERIVDADRPAREIWRVTARNAAGAATEERLGAQTDSPARQGVVVSTAFERLTRPIEVSIDTRDEHWVAMATAYDVVGNVRGRTWWDGTQPRSEMFGYDALNRIVEIDGAARYRYDARGNLTGKDGAQYRYADGICGSERPHALAAVAGRQTAAANPFFVYDANGALLEERADGCDGPVARRVVWNQHHLPAQVIQEGRELRFYYGADGERALEEIVADGRRTVIRYAGSFEQTEADGVVENKVYVRAEGRLVATIAARDGAAVERRYVVVDHLGSTSAILDEERRVLERPSFDAWGRRRAADHSDADATSAERRGFTGHEHLDAVGLIHMNGRIYDPGLGRFLSADSIIDGAFDSQGYNRYSYVKNNPLTLTDPSGHFSWQRPLEATAAFMAHPSLNTGHKLIHSRPQLQLGDDLAQRYPQETMIVATVVAAAASIYCGGCGAAAVWGAIGLGGTSAGISYASGADSGQTWRAGLVTAGTALAFYAVGEATTSEVGGMWGEPIKVQDPYAALAGHAAVGCASAAASHGNCGRGAAAAALGKATTFATDGNPIATIVGGGLGSRITGGRFASGAVTAALGYAFNYLFSIGLNVRIPFVGGAKHAVGLSWENGKLDAGIIIDSDVPTLSAGRMLGRFALDVGVQTGDFESNHGQLSIGVQGGFGSWGVSAQSPSMYGGISGGSVSLGTQYGIEVSIQQTRTISLRGDLVPAFARGWGFVRGWFSE